MFYFFSECLFCDKDDDDGSFECQFGVQSHQKLKLIHLLKMSLQLEQSNQKEKVGSHFGRGSTVVYLLKLLRCWRKVKARLDYRSLAA